MTSNFQLKKYTPGDSKRLATSSMGTALEYPKLLRGSDCQGWE